MKRFVKKQVMDSKQTFRVGPNLRANVSMFSPLELVDSVNDSGFLFIYGLHRPTFVQMEQYHA